MQLLKGKHEVKYKVIETDGVNCPIFDVVNRYAYNEGFVYEYNKPTPSGSLKDYVLVGKHYRYGGGDGVLYIGKNAGNVSAARLVGAGDYMVGKSLDADAPGEDFSLLARTHLMAQGYRTVVEKAVPWRVLLIAGVIGVIVIGIVWFIKSQGA